MSGDKGFNTADLKLDADITEGVLSPAVDSDEFRAIEKKALRKIDFWLVGYYSVVYIFRVIDSSNYSYVDSKIRQTFKFEQMLITHLLHLGMQQF